jgi:hypothetical protein
MQGIAREPIEPTAPLGDRAMATIAAAARVMYPHDALPDDVYARVARSLAEAAREDAATSRTLCDVLAALDRGRPFARLPEDEQVRALTQIEGSDFFELVRSTAVVEVYSDPRTWELVGYEGPSFDQGGYLNRGFNDLAWLPDPEDPAGRDDHRADHRADPDEAS